MEQKNIKTVLHGNTFYEIDLNCQREKQKRRQENSEKNNRNEKRQRR